MRDSGTQNDNPNIKAIYCENCKEVPIVLLKSEDDLYYKCHCHWDDKLQIEDFNQQINSRIQYKCCSNEHNENIFMMAKYFCSQCNKFLCSKCQAQHMNIKPNDESGEEHQVIQLPQNYFDEKCQEEGCNAETKYYCAKCNKNYCEQCAFKDRLKSNLHVHLDSTISLQSEEYINFTNGISNLKKEIEDTMLIKEKILLLEDSIKKIKEAYERKVKKDLNMFSFLQTLWISYTYSENIIDPKIKFNIYNQNLDKLLNERNKAFYENIKTDLEKLNKDLNSFSKNVSEILRKEEDKEKGIVFKGKISLIQNIHGTFKTEDIFETDPPCITISPLGTIFMAFPHEIYYYEKEANGEYNLRPAFFSNIQEYHIEIMKFNEIKNTLITVCNKYYTDNRETETIMEEWDINHRQCIWKYNLGHGLFWDIHFLLNGDIFYYVEKDCFFLDEDMVSKGSLKINEEGQSIKTCCAELKPGKILLCKSKSSIQLFDYKLMKWEGEEKDFEEVIEDFYLLRGNDKLLINHGSKITVYNLNTFTIDKYYLKSELTSDVFLLYKDFGENICPLLDGSFLLIEEKVCLFKASENKKKFNQLKINFGLQRDESIIDTKAIAIPNTNKFIIATFINTHKREYSDDFTERKIYKEKLMICEY